MKLTKTKGVIVRLVVHIMGCPVEKVDKDVKGGGQMVVTAAAETVCVSWEWTVA